MRIGHYVVVNEKEFVQLQIMLTAAIGIGEDAKWSTLFDDRVPEVTRRARADQIDKSVEECAKARDKIIELCGIRF